MVNLLEGTPGIRGVNRVTGPYDVIVEVEAVDIEAVSDAGSDKIHPVRGGLRTGTCVCLN